MIIKAISKANRKSYIVSLGSLKLKLYQSNNISQAKFIQAISHSNKFSQYFPRTYFRKKEYIGTQWISGIPCNLLPENKLEKAIDFISNTQAFFHSQIIPGQKINPGFDYPNFLIQRFNRYFNTRPYPNSIKKIFESLQSPPPFFTPRFSHPDMTLNNIVLQKKSNKFKIIDNELLTTSKYFLLDIFNTHHSLSFSNSISTMYLTKYFKYKTNIEITENYIKHLSALWALRIIGSNLQANKKKKSLELAETFADNCFFDHPILQHLRGQYDHKKSV